MSKLEEVKAILRDDGRGSQSNAAIATHVGCDEGMVRRARIIIERDALDDELIVLRQEIAMYRRIYLPKSRKPRADAFCPLWEQIIGNVPVPTLQMIGEQL